MNFVVKNTTKCGLLDLLCPHSCRGCGQLGAVLCECCKKDILQKRYDICPLCKEKMLPEMHQRCKQCELPFDAVYVVGWREGALMKLVEEYKYQSVWAMGDALAELMDKSIPKEILDLNGRRLDENEIVIVPLPTIGRHVRERGLDHTLRLAKKLGKRRGWKVEQVLARAVDTVQVGAKATERVEQAKQAYVAVGEVNTEKTYILLDDVWTTGASALAAEKVLRKAGAKQIRMAVIVTGRPEDAKEK